MVRTENGFAQVRVSDEQNNPSLKNSPLLGQTLWISIQDLNEQLKFDEVKIFIQKKIQFLIF